jgi:hypothetical protein
MFIYIFFLREYFIISSRLHRALTVSISLVIHRDANDYFLRVLCLSAVPCLKASLFLLSEIDAAAAAPKKETSLLRLPGTNAAAPNLTVSLLLLPGVDAAAGAPHLEASLLLLPGVVAAAAAPYLTRQPPSPTWSRCSSSCSLPGNQPPLSIRSRC